MPTHGLIIRNSDGSIAYSGGFHSEEKAREFAEKICGHFQSGLIVEIIPLVPPK
jgi:hypothetical protein